jgi:anaerobic magnesium-protoporphyrin IX monomethyl ester cyclase
MRVALLNPPWSFAGSIYFGCREPHLPLELGYCRSLLEADGHDVLMLDGALDGLTVAGLAEGVERFAPDMAVLTTAPTYLFWRCAQPELTKPGMLARAIRRHVECLVAIGPHGSATPSAVLAKLPVDLASRTAGGPLCRLAGARLAGPVDPSAPSPPPPLRARRRGLGRGGRGFARLPLQL